MEFWVIFEFVADNVDLELIMKKVILGKTILENFDKLSLKICVLQGPVLEVSISFLCQKP
jgi:hypothetical protein